MPLVRAECWRCSYLKSRVYELRSLLSEDTDPSGKLEIRATLVGSGRRDDTLERIVSRLSLEPSVSGVSWEFVDQMADAE